MSEQRKNQQGFGLVGIILIGVVIAVWITLGYVIYKFHDQATTIHTVAGHFNAVNVPKSQPQNTATANSGQTNQASTPYPIPCHLSNYVTIKEWDVKFALPCNLTSMDYEIHGNSAYLGSPQLEAMESTCSVQNQALGVLVRAADTASFDQPQGLKKIGNYYYDYNEPQDGCGYSVAAGNVQSIATNELRLALIPQTLTAAFN